MSLSKITSIQKATDDADNQVDTDKGVISDYVRRLSLGPPEEADDAILRANGHEAVLERQFKWISALGLGFSITNSWIGYLSNFGQNLIYGGPAVVVFGLIVAFFVQATITLGLSELASAFPSSGGQYHFCYILAPAKQKRFTAFVIGWMSILAWWIVTCSGVSLATVSLLGLIQFFHPSYRTQTYQIWLVYCTVAFVTTLPLFFTPKKIPLTVQATLYASLIGFVLTFIIVLSMAKQHQSGSWLTQQHLGTSGWSDGTAWLLGISNAMYAFGGTDGAIHISEEMPNPGRRVPQVMMTTLLIGLLTALPLMIALMFCMNDLDAVLKSPLPSLEIIYQATGSRAATSFILIWIVACYVICLASQWVTSGRIAWAFARDNGVPYAQYFSHVDEKLGFPVRTTIASFIFVCLYGLLYFASTTAFNSIVTCAVLFLNITYVVPQGIVLFGGREKKLPKRYLRLGYLGYFCNGFSVLWIVVLGVSVCMPPVLPVAVGTMNYTSPIMVGLFALILVTWFWIGNKFEGPKVDWELISVVNTVAKSRNASIAT